MVRIAIFATVLAAISGATALNLTKLCQCLYSDGSHCCVAAAPTGTCQSNCMNSSPGKGKHCNAGGKYSNVSYFTGLGRHPCGPDSGQ